MSLKEALNDIDDTKVLVDYRDEVDTPVGRAILGLYRDYNEKAIHNPQYRVLRNDAVGGDLKLAFSLMDTEDQVNLLYAYNATKRGAVPSNGCPVESPKDRDERNLKSKVILIVIICFSICVCILVGASAVIGVRTGEISGGPMVDGFIDAVTELVKLLFSK